MKIFLSYSSEDRNIAEDLQLSLVEREYEVFFDRQSLPAGEEYHSKIQKAISKSDLLIFLVSPHSLNSGSYALTELKFARAKWPSPVSKILPVVLREIDYSQIPNYLKAVSLFEPSGNITAEVVAEVDNLSKKSYKLRLAISSIIIANIAVALGYIQYIKNFLYEIIGFKWLTILHYNLTVIVMLIFVIGYGLIFYIIYRYILKKVRDKYKSLAWSLLLFIAIGGITYINSVILIPEQPKAQPIIEEESKRWLQRIIAGIDPTGGIRGNPLNPETESGAWITAQALKGVLSAYNSILKRDMTEERVKTIRNAFFYIEAVRIKEDKNEGWGYLEDWPWGVTEIASWVVVAYLESLNDNIKNLIWKDHEIESVANRVEKYIDLIVKRQHKNGGWSPIQNKEFYKFTRTYSTIMAIWSLVEVFESPLISNRLKNKYEKNLKNGVLWVINNFIEEDNIGWVPNPNRKLQHEKFPGLYAQTLFVLKKVEDYNSSLIRDDPAYIKAKKIFIQDSNFTNRPISYNNRQHDSDRYLKPPCYVTEGITFLWYPWALMVYNDFKSDTSLEQKENKRAEEIETKLFRRIRELSSFVGKEFNYVPAESLFSMSHYYESLSKVQ